QLRVKLCQSTYNRVITLLHLHSFPTRHSSDLPDRMKLLGVALNNLHILPEFSTAYITLTQKELDDHNFKKGDTEGFVNYALSVKDRKSTRLNSSHVKISYAVFCLKKKKKNTIS